MSDLASAAFLDHLKSIYPEKNSGDAATVLQSKWYILAAVAFSAANRPEAVPPVMAYVLKELPREEDRRALTVRISNALFKSGLISGYPKTINSLIAIHEAFPDLRGSATLRDTTMSVAAYEKRGQDVFRFIYGETADNVQGLLDAIYPDMGWFSNTIGYGAVYGDTQVTSRLETSYAMVAALIAVDSPLQIGWHLAGAQRVGATLEQVRAARELAMEVARRVGVVWRDGVPEV